MAEDMVKKLVDTRLGANQKLAQYAVMRAEKRMRMATLKATQSEQPQPAPPPPGQGLKLDRSV